MPIHVDDAMAKSVGLPGIIAHGLCTMAMASQGVLRLAADSDPARLRRLAVRFAKPVFPGNDVVTTVYRGAAADGRARFPFEASSAGQAVISHGLAEVDA
jgi:acyl dehydratase